MKFIGHLFVLGLIGLIVSLAIAPHATAEEITGKWHALFETPAGVQTYHFDFQNKDSKLTATAVVETGEQKREVDVPIDRHGRVSCTLPALLSLCMTFRTCRTVLFARTPNAQRPLVRCAS